MRFTQHVSNNVVLGAPKGHDQRQLPIGALPVTRFVDDGQLVTMSFWRPDEEELRALAAGGMVVLFVYGEVHPPVALSAAGPG